MTSPARLGAVLYATESAFAEVSSTFGTRLQTLNAINVSGLEHPRQNINITQQRPHEGVQDVRLTQSGSFTIELMLTGRGATGTSLSATDLSTFLGHVIGTVRTADVGAAITTQTSATQFTATGITLGSGTLARIGVINDARGGGQFHAVASESVDAVTLLTAAAAAPTTADTCYPALIIYPSETPGTFETVQTMRFRLLTANKQYDCHGCYPTAIEFPGLNVGELPKVRITFAVSRFSDANATFPSTTAPSAKTGAPVAAGSLFIQTTGTTTRATYAVRNFGFRVQLETVPLMGPGGLTAHQGIVGCRRTRCQGFITTTLDAETTGTETWADLYNTAEESLSTQHILWTGSASDGKAIGIYAPAAKIISPLPTQEDLEGLNRVTVQWECLSGPTTTSDLTLSNFRLALG